VMGKESLDSLAYVYPKEGVIVWMDSFVIPKNPEAAHKFISFVFRPEIAALISEDIGYATTVLPSYPIPNNMVNAEFQSDIGDDAMQVYAKYREKLKSGL
ncbi:MAG TPA: spermidine/putrescine ABC transporter substrate-binding protein PotD, partial [Marinobacter sp.]|nr:spermidine/putrescine ABC transporter substrate-binding protein PotD [Marinobacter sp.]